MKFRTTGNGKGDSFRPVDKKKYDENWERIFGKKKKEKEQEGGRGSDIQAGE